MPAIDAYHDAVGGTREFARGMDGTQFGGPAKAPAAIEAALDAPDTPLRLQLGARGIHESHS